MSDHSSTVQNKNVPIKLATLHLDLTQCVWHSLCLDIYTLEINDKELAKAITRVYIHFVPDRTDMMC